MKYLSFNKGDTYSYKEEILEGIKGLFSIYLSSEDFTKYMTDLSNNLLVIIDDTRYYLEENYQNENDIVRLLKKIDSNKIDEIDYNSKLIALEKKLNISYNDDQIMAIIGALNNNISIIKNKYKNR